jgi:hypothetical protein
MSTLASKVYQRFIKAFKVKINVLKLDNLLVVLADQLGRLITVSRTT